MAAKRTTTRPDTGLRRVDARVWVEVPPTMPFAVLDLETTGLNPSVDRVIEVAVIRCAPDGTVIDEWSTLVDPGRDPGATHIHGITAADLAGAPTFAAIAPALVDRLEGHMVCAHNLSFDEAFLAAELAETDCELPDTPSLCTLELARVVLDTQNRHTLAACAAELGIAHEGAHRALADTRVTVAVLTAMLDRVHPAQGSLFD